MKIGFVICSRPDSKRVPRKCFTELNGVPLLENLITRCLATGYPVYLAVPGKYYEEYRYLKDVFAPATFSIHMGQGEDPLARTANVANKFELDAVIRVCHDKIFVEPDAVSAMVKRFEKTNADYVFSSTLPAGASIELITRKVLNEASTRFKDVEHISYAIRCVTEKIENVDFSKRWNTKHRLLVDFPKDVEVLDLVLKACGTNCTLDMALWFLDRNAWISSLNEPPKVTVYTCAFNAAKWLEKAMGSVSMQTGFGKMEYLLIDDCSTDNGATALLMQKFCDTYKNARVVRNQRNMGLASSSNTALVEARAPYIIRLDADDYFTSENSIRHLVNILEFGPFDAVYPNNYFGSRKIVQQGNEAHHVGGALFRARAANHVKFTEGLRGYEGLDFFVRAKDQIKIGYLSSATFFYRQHPTSMSKTNLSERVKIRESILKS